MKNSFLQPEIYFTEKDIYDALMSSKRKATRSVILELARDKGIILSNEDSREDLIKYLSSLLYDYGDLNVLLEHITPSHKKEKSVVTKMEDKIDIAHLNKASMDINNRHDDNININITIDPNDQTKKTLTVQYDEIDLSKTRLNQKVRKESTIEIIEENKVTKIRKPMNKKVDEILDDVISSIETQTSKTIEEKKIDLHGFTSEQKTKYFTTLIESIDNCERDDVIKVVVNNDEKEEEVEITNAAFKGKGLLLTHEYQELQKNGYYISSIIWLADERSGDKNKIEFEAFIRTDKEVEELSFAPKGAYRYDKKSKDYTTTRRPLKAEENEKYLKIIENVAFDLYDDMLKTIEES